MALPVAFSLLHSEFNTFLFASIGEEANGMPVSTFSALTRLGIDPWKEAARLSALPRPIARQMLAANVARFPDLLHAVPPTQTAANLLKLLPPTASDGTVSIHARRVAASWANLAVAVVIACVALLTVLLASVQ